MASSQTSFDWIETPQRRSLSAVNGRVRAFVMPAWCWVGFDEIVSHGRYAADDLIWWAFDECDKHPAVSADEHLMRLVQEIHAEQVWNEETQAGFDWFCAQQLPGPHGAAVIEAEARRLREVAAVRGQARLALFQGRFSLPQ